MAPRSTILIIDGPAVNHGALRNIFQREPTMQFTEHSEAGLELARQAPPDPVLLDVEMPKLNGFTGCRQPKATADIQAISITSEDDPLGTRQGLEAGTVDHIINPFYPVEVLARVKARPALRKSHRLPVRDRAQRPPHRPPLPP